MLTLSKYLNELHWFGHVDPQYQFLNGHSPQAHALFIHSSYRYSTPVTYHESRRI